MRVRAQMIVPCDTAFPRDAMVLTPCFKTTALGDTGLDTLANDLNANFCTWIGAAAKITTKLYDLDETPSGPPVMEKTLNSGASPLVSTVPREVSLCLSFYADTNTARRRGRLYLPATWVKKNSGSSSLGAKPTGADQASAGTNFVMQLAGAGGLVTDWCVWSGASHDAHTVTNWWVDDEWDTQRRRGLKPSSRLTGTTAG